ncbi:monovalent cation/H+ antiporter subunit D family protein [Pelagicoccus sp. SDUM812003]|uniref:monovalent cation/H+ antiporter subunit D family protein n=1 Tax=Pelagicoccus sp. SDUM812003 TaxID=3041267 RepID=UPI00280DF44B|nr:monovalent cation/H+ antiporter subunit D family protein [Pelagicoccus sp. SDUM812003]MDQ8202061.1 monovalent cation/H+ antiporter subunit D family protein [Pelagicoccus sp. SDUM812003]
MTTEALSNYSLVPLLAVLVSMAAIPAILLSSRKPNLREAWSFLAAGVKFAFVLTLVPGALRGESVGLTLLEIVPGVSLRLVADPLGVLFALVASGLWIVTTAYALGYMRGHHEKKQTRFFASFALSLSATLGIAFSDNLITFLIFYELLTLATYPLVVHKESPDAIRSGRMYLGYALTAGLMFLAATVWVNVRVGDISFTAGGLIPEGAFGEGELKLLFLLFMVGVGVKAGVMPLHSWLPAAMVAPTPVSALLHAVAVVKSGAFGVLRVTGFVFGPEMMRTHGLDVLLALFAGATILLASLIALRQDNLKKRLAYSTVGHLSYIVMGAALASPAALTGSLMHLSAHAVMKITLFFCAGAIIVHSHKTEISQLDGLGRRMPWTFAAFGIGSLGLAGIPPIYGFLSKWWLSMGSLDSGHALALGVFLLSGLLNAGYFFPIVIRGFFRPAAPDAHFPEREATPWMVVPLCITATLAIVFGLFPDFPLPFFEIAGRVVESVMGELPQAMSSNEILMAP